MVQFCYNPPFLKSPHDIVGKMMIVVKNRVCVQFGLPLYTETMDIKLGCRYCCHKKLFTKMLTCFPQGCGLFSFLVIVLNVFSVRKSAKI